MRRNILMMTAVASAALATPAMAHTPYVAPITFAPDRDYVTVQAGMSETNFFVPDFPIRAVGDYWATGPSGEAVNIGPGVNMKEMSIIEAPLPQEGTWKISTGDRAGRSASFAKIGNEWRSVRAPQTAVVAGPGAPAGPPMRAEGPGGRGGGNAVDASAVPAGAERVESVSVLKAETYVSRGAPSKGALKASGKGFELTPVTHPNELFAGDDFKFLMTNDGKPTPGVEFSIARASDGYAERKFSYAGKTDAAGAATVKFAEPGAYVLETHYGQSEPGQKPTPTSYIYTLSFEVTK